MSPNAKDSRTALWGRPLRRAREIAARTSSVVKVTRRFQT